MSGVPLLDWKPTEPFRAHGKTFRFDRDSSRLGQQCKDVYDAMKDGEWHTLGQISALTGWPEASVSARLRQLRGDYGFTIEREPVENGNGLHRYRMVA